MVVFEHSDLLNVKDGIICHQVNCADVMGSGVAKQIIQKWPRVKDDYHDYIDMFMGKEDLLCKVHYSLVDTNLMVCNMFSQRNYG